MNVHQCVGIILIVWCMSCRSVEHAVPCATASMVRSISTTSDPREQKDTMADQQLVQITLGRRTLFLLQRYFPLKPAQIVFDYSGYENGECIPYYSYRDKGYTRDKKSLLDTKFEVFGLHDSVTPVVHTYEWHVREADEAIYLSDDIRSIADSLHRLYGSPQEHGSFLPEDCYVQYTNDRFVKMFTSHTAYTIEVLLGWCHVVAFPRSSAMVTEGQKRSCLCGAPGVGHYEFAQLLKNAALCFKSAHAELTQRQLTGESEESDVDSLVKPLIDRYQAFISEINKVIDDPSHSLALVFFSRYMTWSECLKMLPQGAQIEALRNKEWFIPRRYRYEILKEDGMMFDNIIP